MAKAAKRKSPARRKAASGTSSVFGISGWLVAGGLGLAWLGPQFHQWTMPSVFDSGRDAPATAARLPASRDVGDPKSFRPDTKALSARPVERERAKPVLPTIRAEISGAIKAKAAPMPALPVPKTPARPRAGAPLPSVPVPIAPLLTAAIRTHDGPRANIAPPPLPAKPGELAVRRYPFTTSPPVAYVGDLRTIRILGGEGDWKKVEVTSTGATGWLRLEPYKAPNGTDKTPSRTAGATQAP